MVVQHYGEGTIVEQAVDYFIDAEYSNILEEADVKPGAAGRLENIESLDPPKLIFMVPLSPEVDLGDYHSIRIPYELSAPGQEQVDKALEELRQMYATTQDVEREVQEGDYVLVDITSETPELNRSGFAAFVRKEERDTEWPYNGFAKELVGLKPAESKTIKHTFPEDWEVEELQGKDVEMEVTVKTVRAVTLPELDDELAKTIGAGETFDELLDSIKKDVENRSQADYDDTYFVDLIEKIKEGATFKYHQHSLEHEEEHVLEDLGNRLAQQGMDLETYFKVRDTTREKFIEEEVKPVAKKRFERSLILDEIVRKEELEVDDTALDAEFNQTLNALTMQGLDINKLKGGKQGKQQLAQAVAMESANRVLTRRALDMLKSIAVDEYKSPEERKAEAEAQLEVAKKAAEAAENEAKEAEAMSAEEPQAEKAESEEAAPEAEADVKSEIEAEASSEEETKN
jgi:trigger factor